MKKKEEVFINKLSKILNVKKNDLLKKDDFTKFEEWDSLKHLEIITELDKLLGKKNKENFRIKKFKKNFIVTKINF